MDHADLLTGELHLLGALPRASNHALLCEMGAVGSGRLVVYKPRIGERPLWDFPAGTLCHREVAAEVVSRHLGWLLVPPTVLRDGPAGTGSVQVFVDHDPTNHYFELVREPRHHAVLARMALFDLLINNADRKGSHVMAAADGRILGCDHGLSFHAEPKLRTVIWELGGRAIPPDDRAALGRLATDLAAGKGAAGELDELLDATELVALRQRAELLVDLDVLPAVDHDDRPYPWPPL